MILFGGALSAGVVPPFRADGNSWFTQSPGADTVAQFTPWFRLVADPLRRGNRVVRSWISHRDYALNPIRASKSAELKQAESVPQWGQTYTYYWRHIIDPAWVSYPGEENTVIGQLHEVNGPVGQHRPTFEFHLSQGQLIFMHTIDAYTLGVTVYSMPFSPGQEVETFVRARWADGSHVADAQGILELYVNGQLVWQINGQRNTWAPNPDDHPCYMVGGVYVPEQLAWWTGRERAVYIAAMVVGDADESADSMAARVSAEMAATS